MGKLARLSENSSCQLGDGNPTKIKWGTWNKKMRNMNLAFFSKNGMEAHYRDKKVVDQNSSCKVCESKMDFSKLEKKRNASNAWKGMVAVREIIK